MENALKFVIGIALGVGGLIGLWLASQARDDGMHLFGLALFAFAVAFDFWLIKRHHDEQEARVRVTNR
ncbi:MAG TPA: hypothetical protein VF342_09385 [Alphaproteobacteria bacterium]